jgi:hypothetical protein
MVRISYHDLKFLEKIIKNNVFTTIRTLYLKHKLLLIYYKVNTKKKPKILILSSFNEEEH